MHFNAAPPLQQEEQLHSPALDLFLVSPKCCDAFCRTNILQKSDTSIQASWSYFLLYTALYLFPVCVVSLLFRKSMCISMRPFHTMSAFSPYPQPQKHPQGLLHIHTHAYSHTHTLTHKTTFSSLRSGAVLRQKQLSSC